MATPPVQPDSKPNPITHISDLRKSTYDENDFKTRLSDEYRILQEKIDKIGAFRFTVKGWSITAVIAAAAASSGKDLGSVCVISVGLVLMLFFFFLLEYEQVKWSRLFGKRAGRLEDVFRQISRGKGAEVYAAFPVPNTAHELILTGYPKKSRGKSPEPHQRKRVLRLWASRWHASRQAHVGFYAILTVLAVSLLAPHHQAIGADWRELEVRLIHTLAAFR